MSQWVLNFSTYSQHCVANGASAKPPWQSVQLWIENVKLFEQSESGLECLLAPQLNICKFGYCFRRTVFSAPTRQNATTCSRLRWNGQGVQQVKQLNWETTYIIWVYLVPYTVATWGLLCTLATYMTQFPNSPTFSCVFRIPQNIVCMEVHVRCIHMLSTVSKLQDFLVPAFQNSKVPGCKDQGSNLDLPSCWAAVVCISRCISWIAFAFRFLYSFWVWFLVVCGLLNSVAVW